MVTKRPSGADFMTRGIDTFLIPEYSPCIIRNRPERTVTGAYVSLGGGESRHNPAIAPEANQEGRDRFSSSSREIMAPMTPTPTGMKSAAEIPVSRTSLTDLPIARHSPHARSCRDLCEGALDLIRSRAGAEAAILFLLDPADRALTRAASSPRGAAGAAEPKGSLPLAGNHGAIARAIHTQQCQPVGPDEAGSEGYDLGCAVPIVLWSQPIGACLLLGGRTRDLAPDAAEALRRAFGTALEEACLDVTPGARTAGLVEASRRLGSAGGREILRTCLESALSIARVRDGMLLVSDAEGLFLTVAESAGAAEGSAAVRFHVREPVDLLSATVVDRRGYRTTIGVATTIRIPAGLEEAIGAREVTTVPLIGGARVEGVIVLSGETDPGALEALRVFGALAGCALERAREDETTGSTGGQRYREFVERSSDGCVESSPDGRVLYFNDAVLRILGCTREDLLSRNARSWYVDPGQREEMLRRHDRTGGIEGMDISVRRGDGTIVHLNIATQPGHAPDGTPVLRSIVRDVTARHEAERRLKLLADAVTSSADAIVTLDAGCRILSWNRGAEEIFGYEAVEVIGGSYARLVPPDLMDEFQHVIRARAERDGQVAGYETWRLRKDGTRVPVSITVTRMPGERDAASGWSVVVRDITERRREEQHRRLLSSITEQSPDAILSVDKEGIITSWNLGAEKMFALPAAEILGRSWITLAPERNRQEFESVLASCRPGEGASIDTFALRRDGRKLPVRLSASVLDALGEGQVGWSLILRDLTEQRVLAEVSERLREELYSRNRLEGIVGDSRSMEQVRERIRRVSRFNSSVLLIGESGTGKEIVANAIHYNSPRRDRPFIKVNCAAIPESLLESELFGIERNVATGVDGRMGRFEMADGGTLFLDEIGDMSLPTQARILRVLQEREFERVGGKQVIRVDVRIIAATNKDLEKEIEARRFRNDLYYRLNVIVIALPPLAARPEDIDPLIDHFVEKFTRENGLPRKRVALPARMLLNQYDWPGNVRELEHCIERAVVMGEGPDIVEADLPPAILIWKELGGSSPDAGGEGGASRLADIMRQVERRTVLNALERSGWVQARAARLLGISERSMWYRVKKLGLKHG